MATHRHIPLSDNHRRVVTASLTLLDDWLCELADVARGREVHSVLYHERNDLSAAERERMLDAIARAHETLREMRETFRLEPTVVPLSREVRGTVSSLWENLIETQSRRLRGYGKVPQALADYLDPSLQRLIDCVLGIAGVAAGNEADRVAREDEEQAHDGQVQQGEQAKS